MSPFVAVCYLFFLVAGISVKKSAGYNPSCTYAVQIVTGASSNHDQAVRNHDINTAASFYDPDVIVMPEGHPTIAGRATWKPTMKWINNVASVSVTLDQVACLDNGRLVIVRKTSKITAKGGVVMFDGKTIQIWRRTDTGYYIYLEMYNNNS